MVRPIVVLPQPDSPTIPTVLPEERLKDTPSTAFKNVRFFFKKLLPMGKYFLRFFTCKRYSGLPSAPETAFAPVKAAALTASETISAPLSGA